MSQMAAVVRLAREISASRDSEWAPVYNLMSSSLDLGITGQDFYDAFDDAVDQGLIVVQGKGTGPKTLGVFKPGRP